MAVINVTTCDGHQRAIEGQPGRSLMESLRAGGIEELLALCSGCVSCGTCHVYVADEWLTWLPAMDEDEDYLLRMRRRASGEQSPIVSDPLRTQPLWNRGYRRS